MGDWRSRQSASYVVISGEMLMKTRKLGGSMHVREVSPKAATVRGKFGQNPPEDGGTK